KGLEFGDLNNSDEAINVNEDLIKEKADIVKSQIGFDELLHDLVSSIKSHLEILKGYFILKLENSNLEDYELLVLYDEKYFFEPIKKNIAKKIPKSTFKGIKEFNE